VTLGLLKDQATAAPGYESPPRRPAWMEHAEAKAPTPTALGMVVSLLGGHGIPPRQASRAANVQKTQASIGSSSMLYAVGNIRFSTPEANFFWS